MICDRRLVGIKFLDLNERERRQVVELIAEIERLQAEAATLRN